MSHEVAPGRCLLHSGTRYPAGALVPDGIVTEGLCDAGVLREVSTSSPKRPEPEAQSAPPVLPDFSPSDPSSVTNIPLRLLPRLLRSIEDMDLLLEMHEADTRKGGKDAIEERMGELEVDNG